MQQIDSNPIITFDVVSSTATTAATNTANDTTSRPYYDTAPYAYTICTVNYDALREYIVQSNKINSIREQHKLIINQELHKHLPKLQPVIPKFVLRTHIRPNNKN